MINFVKTTRRNLQNLEQPDKTYAVAQSRDNIDIEGLAQHIASHGNTYDEGDVIAICKKIVNCMREMLLDGYIVSLGDLGTFSIRLKSNGVCESVEDDITGKKPVFSAANITGVNVVWAKSKRFQNMIADAKFNEVDTLKAMSESLKKKSDERIEGTTGSDNGSDNGSGTTGGNDQAAD